MSLRPILKIVAAAAALSTTMLATPATAQQKFMTIGTGGVTGVYYAAGGAICRLVNKDRTKHGYRCTVESTGGSVANVNTLRSGDLDFGVAQSDWNYHGYKGTSSFQSFGPFEDLRSVFALHPEPFTMLARADDDRVIRLHPDDMALVAPRLAPDWGVEPDPALERGSLRVETASGGVEDGPATWRRAIAEALHQC